MNDEIGSVIVFLIAIVLGFSLFLLVFKSDISLSNEIKAAVEVCEESLPRNEHCKVTITVD